MEFKSQRRSALLGCAVALVLFGGVPAKADLSSVNLDQNIENDQTGPSTVTLAGTFVDIYAYMAVAGEYTSGTLTYPGPGSPQALSPGTFAGPNVGYQSAFLGDEAALAAAYPFGTYTFQAFGAGPASSAVAIDYTSAPFGNTPALTAGSYTALQGLNASLPDTVDFNGFTPVGGVSESFVFFNVYDVSTGTDVFSDNFAPSSTTSVTIPGGTLAAGTAYSYELIYDDRFDGTDANGSGISTFQLFDNRTEGDFTTTAVPDPSSLALSLTVLGFLALLLRRKSVREY